MKNPLIYRIYTNNEEFAIEFFNSNTDEENNQEPVTVVKSFEDLLELNDLFEAELN